jgi:hypothetical protein
MPSAATNRLMMMNRAAFASLSMSVGPTPQSHSGSRTGNGRPSGTWAGQVAAVRAPSLTSTPVVCVVPPDLPQLCW